MTYKPADYSKGLIYKLCSNDTDIKDIYVGSTTKFNYRKYNHKSCCHNEKNKSYNYNLYKFIRENGGWEEWNMILIEYYQHNKEKIAVYRKIQYEENKDKILEKRKEYYENNKEQIAEKNKQTITCECGVISTKCHIARHLKTKKHQNYINALHSHHLKDF